MMFADPRWHEALGHLPDYLSSHIHVSIMALALGLALSLPLALFARHHPVLRSIALGVASIVQTVPGLALLALFYPLLLALSGLTLQWFGFSFSAFGFLPSMLALALYSMLPVLRNTITGLDGIDPMLIEAADAAGMTPRQSLVMVQLPLALPVIMAGIRTSAVWVIGTATLATPIGQTTLGNYIFAGLQTQNWVFVVFGCVAAAVLALAVDQLLALIENGLRLRSRLRIGIGAVGLALLLIAALLPARAQTGYVIGAKPFPEQYVLASLIEQRLKTAGLSARLREGLGSNLIYSALESGEIDVYVEYSGTLWANLFKRSDNKPRAEVNAELKVLLAKRNVTLFGELGFENAYVLVMPRARAEALGIRTIADLARHSQSMTMGTDYEFGSRPEWAALARIYGLNFKAQKLMQPDFMYAALDAGDVDVVTGYTSDGRLADDRLVVLEDPGQAIPPYDALVLLSPKRAQDRALQDALRPLLGSIDVTSMREANKRAATPGAESSASRVAQWLWDRVRRK